MTIQAATRAGVSAYAVGKLTDARVKTIIESAVARFHEFQALQQELEKTKTNLAERKVIERAKELSHNNAAVANHKRIKYCVRWR